MNKTILIDSDDTCIDLLSPWVSLYNYKWEDELQVEDIKSWDMELYVKKVCGKYIYSLLTPELYRNIKAIEGAVEGIKELKKMDYNIVYVTALHPVTVEAKFRRMQELGFEPTLKTFICASNKSLVKGDYLIDDNVDNVQSFSSHGEKGILFSRGHNANSTYTPRCNTWEEIIRYFSKESK
jgi:5'(3')-deoxyribonucleotidase